MADLKKEGLVVTQLELKSMGGENSLKAAVPIVSEAYQGYLDAVKKDAELTEKYGGRTTEGIEGIRVAVLEVNNLAKEILLKNKSN